MKKFILKSLLFCLLLIGADIIIGGTYHLYDYIKGGEIGKAHDVMTRIEPDILILGSSRAAHHYNPRIIAKETGMEVYNAGFDGQGTLLEYGLVKGVTSRHKPKIFICELTPNFDIYQDPGSASINTLAPYADKYALDSLFYDIAPMNKWKMKSNAFVYNSIPLRILPNLLSKRTDFDHGYGALTGEFKGEIPQTYDTGKKSNKSVDPIKTKYFNKLYCEALDSDISVIFAVSPMLTRTNRDNYKYVRTFAEEHNIPFFDHSQDTTFTNHPELFRDATHMNYKGADLYTAIITQEMTDYLNAQDR